MTLRQAYIHAISVTPFAWIPWNPSNFEQLVSEPINFGKIRLKLIALFSSKQEELGDNNLK